MDQFIDMDKAIHQVGTEAHGGYENRDSVILNLND